MVAAITQGIKVSVSVDYQPEYSNPHKVHHVFAYKITIENNSAHTVQLLRRRWNIEDITLYPKEVEGVGVVGQQPILEPNQVHRYVSTCILKTGIGRMSGFYTMERVVDGKKIEVEIPAFKLIADYRLN